MLQLVGGPGGLVYSSRYAINELVDMYNELHGASTFDQQALGNLLDRAAREKHNFGTGRALPPRTLPMNSQLASSVVGDIGRTLLDLDVELRRTISFISDGSTRPLRDRNAVEFLSARQTSSTDIFLLLSRVFYEVLTSRPLDFLVTFSWFWEHRLNQTRSRPAQDTKSHINVLNVIGENARASLNSGQPVVITISIATGGSTDIVFDAGRPD